MQKTINTVEELRKRLAAHDWWHMMSDSHSVWSKGNADISQIKDALYTLLSEEEANALWNKYCPENFRR